MTFLLSWSLTTVAMAETLRLNKKLFDARLSGSQQDKVAPQARIGGLSGYRVT